MLGTAEFIDGWRNLVATVSVDAPDECRVARTRAAFQAFESFVGEDCVSVANLSAGTSRVVLMVNVEPDFPSLGRLMCAWIRSAMLWFGFTGDVDVAVEEMLLDA